ncbi:hypothetical protein HKCCE4037_14915 [Rhodobacterales bacterium HKCCE4037]|nr:hypothetical protein [Rhodobacterales bacterium HKCCE4037]
MSAPGTRQWWIETSLIAAGGFALAFWLWDGVPDSFTAVSSDQTRETPAPERAAPRDLGDLMAAGCLTHEDLRALVEGRPLQVTCPDDIRTQPQPPDPRPFP